MSKNVDFIIVGQGLAGSVLAHILLRNDKSLHVFDTINQNSSSRVAAGLYNPITGRKMVKTWNADKLFPIIEPFYADVEKIVGSKFLHKVKIYRPFISIVEQNEWQGKSVDPIFEHYIDSISSSSCFKNVVDPFGGIKLRPSGFVDISNFLDSTAHYLKELKSLTSQIFDHKEMKVGTGTVEYGGITATKVVFCTGINLESLFSFLPLRPVKGEILEISSSLDVDSIINRGVFVIPGRGGNYRVGATYNRKDLSVNMSMEGEKHLTEKFEHLIDADYKIIGSKAGIRPTTPDRRPFIGLHPKMQEIGIFNGFGTKGVSLAPYYANQFYRAIEFDENLDSEVNITRFFRYLKRLY